MVASYRLVYVGVLALLLSPVAQAADGLWGQYPGRNMVSEEKGLPDSFDPAARKNIRWAVKIGTQAHATVVVGGGKVLIGTNNNNPRDPKHKGDRGVLMCFDEKTGNFLWQLIVPKRSEDRFFDWPEMGICGTPAIEGDRVYALTNRNELVCLDLAGLGNGNDGYQDEARHMTPKGDAPLELGPSDADIVWIIDLNEVAGTWQHDGPATSPLVAGDLVYIGSNNGVDNTHRLIRRPQAPALIVLDKKTGRMVARDVANMAPRTVHSTWSSPSMGTVNGRELVFFGGPNGLAYAFDALKPAQLKPDGFLELAPLWSFDIDPKGPKQDIHQFMGNRTRSASNILSMPVFHEGKVYVTGGGDIWWGKRQSWLKCIDPSGSGDVTATHQVWSYEMNHHCVATPAIADGLIYINDSGRKIHCIDAKTGQAVWVQDTRGDFWGSCMVADGKVYTGTRRGDFWILQAGREKKVLCEVQLDSGMSCTPTISNQTVYVATMNVLYAIGK